MAGLIFNDIVGAANQGYDRGQGQQFNRLAGQAISDPDNASAPLGLAAAINPGKALGIQQELQTTQDAKQKKLAGAANYLLSAYKTGNPQQVEGAYQAVRPYLNQLGQELGQGPASPNFTPDMLPHLYQIVGQAGGDTAINGAVPTGLRELQGQITGAGLAQGSDEAKKAYRVALGLDARAITGAAKTGMITGADGRERPYVFDPSTQGYKVFDGQSFRPLDQTEASQLGGQVASPQASIAAPAQPTPEQLMATATQMANKDGPGSHADEAQAWLQQQMAGQGRLPTPVNGQGALGVSRAPEDTAGAVQNAKNASDTAFLPQQENIKNNAAIARTGAEQNLKNTNDRNNQARANTGALAVWNTALTHLQTSLDNTSTGPISGHLPAVTANQQIAEGSIAQMAPVLKQVFRQAGEGTFTDRDQDLLLNMVPTRTDQPEARTAKLQFINDLVKAKLATQPVVATGVTSTTAKTQPSGQHAQPQTQADFDALPSGSVYVDPDDGQTYRKP